MKMPIPETYEEGLKYWAYGKLLKAVLEFVVAKAPTNGRVIDLMCGPGYLLGEIVKARPDLHLLGVDIEPSYVEYGRSKYQRVEFVERDILTMPPDPTFDVVMCSGSVHHIHYDKQPVALAAIAAMVKWGGVAVVSDVYVRDYTTERQRQLAATELGAAYLKYAIVQGAPARVLEWTIEILHNDVLMVEYKTSLAKRLPILRKHFHVDTLKTWPDEQRGYGEYVHFCSPLS
jgi:SAM-dependent methyltransferase